MINCPAHVGRWNKMVWVVVVNCLPSFKLWTSIAGTWSASSTTPPIALISMVWTVWSWGEVKNLPSAFTFALDTTSRDSALSTALQKQVLIYFFWDIYAGLGLVFRVFLLGYLCNFHLAQDEFALHNFWKWNMPLIMNSVMEKKTFWMCSLIQEGHSGTCTVGFCWHYFLCCLLWFQRWGRIVI